MQYYLFLFLFCFREFKMTDEETDRSVLASELLDIIFDYVKEDKVSKVQEMINEYGIDIINIRDQWGYTIAHWAALNGSIKLIQLLIDKKVPINLSCFGTQGPKPVHWACRKGHVGVIALLLDAKVDINVVDFKGLTPLMTACIYGRINTCVFLLGMGAKHCSTDVNGDTAAHWATFKGYSDIIRVLINAGADFQSADNFGSTPLHLACIYGHYNCVKILCDERKLNLEKRDKNNKTPLMLARSHQHHEIVKLLQSKIRKKSRYNVVEFAIDVWSATCQIFGNSNTKYPLIAFVGSMLIFCYPVYFYRCFPLTWDTLNVAHYCYFYWTALMWFNWFISLKHDPGYLPTNTDNYAQIIKGIRYDEKNKKQFIPFSQLCHTCRCIRPLRSKHCRICNRCVAYFDHHCAVIDNCVGLKNRTWFFFFLLCLAINSSFSLYFTIYSIIYVGFESVLIFSLIQSIVTMYFSWLRTVESLFYACMNLTSNEMFNYKRYPYLRSKKGRYYNWFSRGLVLNLLEFFIGYKKFRGDVDDFA